jgi:hypothetical protein
MKRHAAWLAGTLVLLGVASLHFLLAEDPKDAKPEDFKPKWKVGQKWVVETLTEQIQVRRDPKQNPKPKPVQWHFEVQGIEKIDGQECYKVDIKAQVGDRTQPVTTIWSNTQTMMLAQMQTQLPVQGGVRKVTEYYQAAGKGAPVMAPLSLLPLEMPVFHDDAGEKGLGPKKFTYQVAETPPGAKAPGDVNFGFEVEQEITPATAEDARGKVAEEFSKGLEKTPLVKVKLSSRGRRTVVNQLWQTQQPWPVWSSNGVTEARLLKVIPAEQPK